MLLGDFGGTELGRRPPTWSSQAGHGDSTTPTPANLMGSPRSPTTQWSWVIVRDISVDDTRATVRFDWHALTSSSAETVTVRSVTATAGAVVDVEGAL